MTQELRRTRRDCREAEGTEGRAQAAIRQSRPEGGTRQLNKPEPVCGIVRRAPEAKAGQSPEAEAREGELEVTRKRVERGTKHGRRGTALDSGGRWLRLAGPPISSTH